MRTVPSALPAALFALTISAFQPLPLHAQSGAFRNDAALAVDVTATPFLRRAAAIEGATRVTREEQLVRSACPGIVIPIKVAYPQGIDAGGPVDEAVRSYADIIIESTQEVAREFEYEPEDCEAFTGSSYALNAAAFRVSAGVFSVLLIMGEHLEGNRQILSYFTLNLTADGTELTAEDLFADPAKSLPLLWERIYRSTCTGDHETGPSYYGSLPCSGDSVPGLPDNFASESMLEMIGNVSLTSLGLTINLNPTEAWSEDSGPFRLDIPKDDLVAMGADPELWD
ncbi:MAG: hypothetical protein LBQ79_01030 [Deltaproteobacteria bacterium]|jgi:hypothetical protein|nr:hypothetical protein [Deltaproteobacteria bacterium]